MDPAVQSRPFEGWGTSLCWWANVVGGFPDPIRRDYMDKIFDPVTGLGLTVVRYNIGGGENPNLQTSLSYRALVPGYEPSKGVWDWNADANQRRILREAMAMGANQVEAFSNSPPYWMAVSGGVSGAKDGGDNLRADRYGDFADYLAEVVRHFHDSWGVTFRDVEPLNEPVAGWWKFGGRQEGCHFDRASQNTIVKALAASLAARQVRVPVAAPDENSIDETVASFGSYDTAARAAITQVNTHSYSGRERARLADDARAAGKALWMSEYGDGDASGMTLSKRILADMKTMRPTAWVYWQAVDGGGWGLLVSRERGPDDYAYTVNKKYSVMAQYSRFIRPGSRFVAVADDNTLAAYDAHTRRLSLVTTNDTDADVPVTYDLSRFGALGKTAAVRRTSPGEDAAKLPALPVHGGRLTAAAKAHSVTTYVVSGVRLGKVAPAGQ